MAVEKVAEKQKYEVQLVVETFLILEKILEAKNGLALIEICNSTQITKNKAFRVLATMIQCGILAKDERNIYKVGMSSIENAHRILGKPSSLSNVHHIMESLSGKLNEAVYFAKYDGREAVLVDCVDCSQSIKAASFIGAAMTLPTVTRGTAIAEAGNIAVETDCLSAEITTVSIPYADEYGVETGAVVVLAPTYRMTAQRIKTEIAPALRDVMPRLQLPLHSRAPEKTVPVFPSAVRDYAKYAHLVTGKSVKTAKTVEIARS